ncbi:MAG: mandelate racemase [Bacteroidetes bacterium]|nr:mandelate racemase [Bacteroidota bacterium]
MLIQDLSVSAYTVPTDGPEADGTIAWNSTTIVIVKLRAGGKEGIGYTYAHATASQVIGQLLKPIVIGKDAMSIPAINAEMIRAIRNIGAFGIAMMAVSAVDVALWDLKAKIFDLPLADLLGKQSDSMLIYGSGGFTSYTLPQLQQQLAGWVNIGITAVKMKVGTHPDEDPARVRAAREAIGDAQLFIDANGAYAARQAIAIAAHLERYDIRWFEEPVPSDDLAGLRFIRQHVGSAVNIVAGEYGYSLPYFKKMLQAGAVDILQGDATRCGGITGFLKAGHLCEAWQLPYSSHCAPALHLHAALALPSFYIAEYFYDHARIEELFFDGVSIPAGGRLKTDSDKPGLGLTLKEADVRKYLI